MASLPTLLKRRIYIIIVALAAVLVVGGALLFVGLRGPSDDTQIQRLVQNFASAADHQDAKKVMAQLCQVEASGFADSDAADSSPVATPESHFLTTTASDIQIAGDTASAIVTRSQEKPSAKSFSTTLYFFREGGAWKVCASAATQFKQHHKGSN